MIETLRRDWFCHRSGRRGSLLEFDDGRPLDPVAVATFLAYGGLVGRRGLLADVEAVLTPLQVTRSTAATDRGNRLWELLCRAVGRAVVGRSRVRCALSGGLDSRAIAAAAAHVGAPGLTFGTFGDPGHPDLAGAEAIARALQRPHVVHRLGVDDALRHEERVWEATDGLGGPATSPGAPTDAAWANDCDVLLSGCAGDVIWGDTRAPGPSPAARLRKLGVRPKLDTSWSPEPPNWVSRSGAAAWVNLHGRQRTVTWSGVLPRLTFTPVVPIAWDPDLLGFALTMTGPEREGRRLLRDMLERHAPAVAPSRIPAVKTAGVHDLDHAWRIGSGWSAELDRWTTDPREAHALEAVGLRPSAVFRMVSQIRAGDRRRAAFLSRVRALRRWGLRRTHA